MRIGFETNGETCEYTMQDAFESWLKEKELRFMREVTVQEVSRRADFLIVKPKPSYYFSGPADYWKGSQLINVEAKCNDVQCALAQIKDHAKYCDYSFLFLPDYSMIPKWAILEIQKFGIGLIMYNHSKKQITEALPAF